MEEIERKAEALELLILSRTHVIQLKNLEDRLAVLEKRLEEHEKSPHFGSVFTSAMPLAHPPGDSGSGASATPESNKPDSPTQQVAEPTASGDQSLTDTEIVDELQKDPYERKRMWALLARRKKPEPQPTTFTMSYCDFRDATWRRCSLVKGHAGEHGNWYSASYTTDDRPQVAEPACICSICGIDDCPVHGPADTTEPQGDAHSDQIFAKWWFDAGLSVGFGSNFEYGRVVAIAHQAWDAGYEAGRELGFEQGACRSGLMIEEREAELAKQRERIERCIEFVKKWQTRSFLADHILAILEGTEKLSDE